MKNYTNEELCKLISQPCLLTAKAEYFKRIKFTDECLSHKLVLHVPTKKYENGKFVDINYKLFMDVMTQYLEADSYYIADAVGHYQGRAYPEKLVTLFLKEEQCARVDYYFRHTIVKCHLALQQKAYAYELDDKLYVVSL